MIRIKDDLTAPSQFPRDCNTAWGNRRLRIASPDSKIRRLGFGRSSKERPTDIDQGPSTIIVSIRTRPSRQSICSQFISLEVKLMGHATLGELAVSYGGVMLRCFEAGAYLTFAKTVIYPCFHWSIRILKYASNGCCLISH